MDGPGPEYFVPPSFDPVPLDRIRHDGWTAQRQRDFIAALIAMGSVGQAAKAVGMGKASAYNLRKRPGAGDFNAAWDRALNLGRGRIFDIAMDRAINGVTTIRLLRGGSIDIDNGIERRQIGRAHV